LDLLWEQEAGGSNPPTPTSIFASSQAIMRSPGSASRVSVHRLCLGPDSGVKKRGAERAAKRKKVKGWLIYKASFTEMATPGVRLVGATRVEACRYGAEPDRYRIHTNTSPEGLTAKMRMDGCDWVALGWGKAQTR
jgi:hypothetical protein